MLCVRMLLRLAAIGAVVFVLVKFGGLLFSILLPFLAALLLAWLVNPLIRVLQKKFGGTRKIWATVSTAAIMTVLSVALCAAVYGIYYQLRSFVSNWPTLLSSFLVNLQQAFERIAALFGFGSGAAAQIENALQWLLEKLTEWLRSWNPPVLESAGSVLTITANVVITVAVFVLASCYIMSDFPRFRYLVERHVPDGIRRLCANLRRAAAAAVGGYFKAQFILSAIVAVICLIVLLVLRQPFSALIALAVGIIDFIPIFGSGTILVPWGVLLLLSGSYSKALVLFVLAAVLFLLRKLAEPRVLGGQTGLSTLLSLICIYVGMRLGGVLGMILAPVLCLMIIHLYRLGTFDAFLGDCRDLSASVTKILNG